jgi:propionyl-CoA synthetase
VLASHPDIAECAVIGIKDSLKGEVPCGFLVLKSGVARAPATVEAEAVQLIRDQIGAVAAFRLAIAVDRLPKTRSGKILRGTMKKIADEDPWTMPATIEDAAVLDDITAVLRKRVVAA